MAVDIWVSTILRIIFILAATHISLTKIIPMVQDFLSSIFKDKKTLDGITSLFGILVLILAVKELLPAIETLNNNILNYLLTLEPALTVLLNFVYYLQFIILAVFVVAVFKAYKK